MAQVNTFVPQIPIDTSKTVNWFFDNARNTLDVSEQNKSIDLNPLHLLGKLTDKVRNGVGSTLDGLKEGFFEKTREALGSLFR